MQQQEVIHKKKFVIVDICGTLYDSNTTFDFLDNYVQSGYYHVFRKIAKTYLGRVINALFWRICRVDIMRVFAFRFIQGHDRAVLLHAVDVFYENQLLDKKHKEIFNIIEEYKNQQYEIIIASATMDIMGETVAGKNDIQIFFSTILEYQDGVCTGRMLLDLLGRKLEILGKNGIIPPFPIVITDNTSDINLIKNATYSYIVLNNKNRKKWNRLVQKYQIKNYQTI
jgi:phosphoserine phosphatase